MSAFLLFVAAAGLSPQQNALVAEKVWERELPYVWFDPATKKAAYQENGQVFRLHATTGNSVRVFDRGLKPDVSGPLHIFGNRGFSRDFMVIGNRFESNYTFPPSLDWALDWAVGKAEVEVDGVTVTHLVMRETDSQMLTLDTQGYSYLVSKSGMSAIARIPVFHFSWSVVGNPDTGGYFFSGRTFGETSDRTSFVFFKDVEVKSLNNTYAYDVQGSYYLGATIDKSMVMWGPSPLTLFELPSGKVLWANEDYRGGVILGDYVLSSRYTSDAGLDVLDLKTGKVIARSVMNAIHFDDTRLFTEAFVSDEMIVRVQRIGDLSNPT